MHLADSSHSPEARDEGERVSGPPRSLILGSFSRLPAEQLAPFTRSLRATGFDGRFWIFAAGYRREGLAELAAFADRVQTVDQDYVGGLQRTIAALGYVRGKRGLRRAYPFLFEGAARAGIERRSFDRWKNLEFRLEGLQTLRYMHYYRCLLEEAPDVDVVMISDLRDVIFQRDPFHEPLNGLELFLEDSSVRIGRDDFNTRWLLDLFGEEGVDRVRDRPVSCSGTVFGTRDSMLAYLAEMIANIAWRRRAMGSHDQGIHNALIYAGRFPGARVIANEHGRVLTLGNMKTFRTSDDGFLLNADGTIPPVIHQWDRHASLVSRLPRFANLIQID